VKEFLSEAILGDQVSKKICIAESRLHIIPANQRKKIGTSYQYACMGEWGAVGGGREKY
jgi:ABC-type uncharacterized transport system YnjBCD ATPase subunit